jgi:hypothetical protein
LHDGFVDLQRFNIEQWQVEAAGDQAGDVLVAGQFAIDQIGDKGQVVPARLFKRLDGRGFIQQMIQHQLPGETGQLAAGLGDGVVRGSSHCLRGLEKIQVGWRFAV